MDKEQLISIRGYVRAYKWQGLRELLFDIETDTKTDIEILEHDQGWLQETIYFKIKGKYENVKVAIEGIKYSMKTTEEKAKESNG